MRARTQGAGSAIDRVFNPPVLPARKFRRTIDAALILALGSVCAFGLTLGPAPMNTVALSSPGSSSFGETSEPAPGSLLLPDDVDEIDSGNELPGESFRPRLPASAESTGQAGVEPSAESTAPVEPRVAPRTTPQPQAEQPPPAKPLPQAEQPLQPQARQSTEPPQQSPLPTETAGPQLFASTSALTVVENYRIASGFDAFVAAADCAKPVAQVIVTVTPSLMLPPGQAKKALVPDPAYATINEGPGALAVTIHSCE